MICFRDRSYCNRVCDTVQCERNFTPAVKVAAEEWWEMFKMPERAAPIAFSPHHARVCGEYRAPVATHSAQALDKIPTHGMVQS